jgi:hypothetical protein
MGFFAISLVVFGVYFAYSTVYVHQRKEITLEIFLLMCLKIMFKIH